MLKQYKYYILVCSLLSLAACNTMYLPKGEKLYSGADIKIKGDSLKKNEKKALQAELKGLIRPKPNSSYLGMRPQLLAYNLAGTPKKTKGFRHWLKYKVGQPPMLASNVGLKNNERILQNRLENKGFFHANVTGDTTSRKRIVKAYYKAIPGPQFRINAVAFSTDSSLIEKAVAATALKTLLKPGDYYNLDVIKGERDRIEQVLKEKGFYYFGSNYLLIKVDSTIGNHKVNLFVSVKLETPKVARESFIIGDIYIFPNFSLAQTLTDTSKSNAVFSGDFYINDNENTFKPKVYKQSVIFRSGDVYSRKNHTLSLNRLTSLGTFKFVKTRFEKNGSASKPTLDAFYYLTPLPRKSLRAEVLATTKSNNMTGSELSLSWKNRNTFHGAEQFQLRGYGSFEVQISGTQKGYNTYKLGAEASLFIPRFMVPFVEISTTDAFIPRTKFTLGYEILNKSTLYTLTSFRASAGYNWKENIRKEHELNPVSIIYVQPSNLSQLYSDSVANNPSLAKTIEKQFIVGSTYSFTYTDQMEVARRNHIYFNGNIDIAGNVPGLIQGANYKTGDSATLFGARYSQYIKADIDLRYYFKTGQKSKVASHIILGFGYPYGNSSQMPFIKQFYTGGSNSIRAFRARSVGPGTYHQADAEIVNFIPDQSGDIKLELNTEYRFNIVSVVNGALFADAGNTWLYNYNPEKPGSQFTKAFLNELAVGTGVGLRFDLSFLLLRTDLAFPIRKPWLAKGNQWTISQVDFTSAQWRRENLVFNLAIGYPF